MKKFKLTYAVFVHAEDSKKIPTWEIMSRLENILNSYSNNDYLHRNLTYVLEEVKE
jgi:hypothetical protein